MLTEMDKINRIWQHPAYQEEYRRTQELEKTRQFCGHSLEHFLDVARLMWIYNLETGCGLTRECVYGAALLHDIGRGRQYEDGTPHHVASARLAEPILRDCGFSEEEKDAILEAILGHRSPENDTEISLKGFLYRADKRSRNCLTCPVEDQCDWAPEKKNLQIRR